MSALVLGATGTTGAKVLRGSRAKGIAAFGAARKGSDRRFDWSDVSTHDAALAGVDRMYVLPPPGDAAPEERTIPFLERARAAGVRRFVLLSSSAIEEGDPGLGRIDAWLRSHVPQWTILRPSWFMENFFDPSRQHQATIAAENRIVSATGDGKVGFIASEDIAAVAVAALTDGPQRTAPVLTGPAALSYGDVAAILSRTLGHPVRHDSVTVEELARRFTTLGIPEAYAIFLAGLDEAIARGAEAKVTDEVQRWTGRAPIAFAQLAEARAGKTRAEGERR